MSLKPPSRRFRFSTWAPLALAAASSFGLTPEEAFGEVTQRLVEHNELIEIDSTESAIGEAKAIMARASELARIDSRFSGLELAAAPRRVDVGTGLAWKIVLSYSTNGKYWLKTRELKARCTNPEELKAFEQKLTALSRDATVIQVDRLGRIEFVFERRQCAARYQQFQAD